jgi:hypothetical protein
MGRLSEITRTIPAGVRLVAVSKTAGTDKILSVYREGQRAFGENRAQSLLEKQPLLPHDIEWHFIGHLQTNKVRYIVPFISMIHSVDSLKLLAEIDKEAARNQRVVPCLLQFHIATEETKYGLDLDEAAGILKSSGYREMQHVRIAGVMGMATFTEDTELVRREFSMLRDYFERLRNDFFQEDEGFREISMGMSGDYRIAIEEGSTMVRIGSAIFSE